MNVRMSDDRVQAVHNQVKGVTNMMRVRIVSVASGINVAETDCWLVVLDECLCAIQDLAILY